MNVAQLAYLEAAIEEERYRKVEEAETAYRRDMEALAVVRGLYERYGDLKAPEDAAGEKEEDDGWFTCVECGGDAPDGGYCGKCATPDDEVDAALREVAESGDATMEADSTPDPPDAAGAVEEEQRVEAGEPEPKSVEPEPAEPEVPDSHKPCKRCGPVVGAKPVAAFGRHSSFADGRDNRCKDCRKEMRRFKQAGTPDPGPSAETAVEEVSGVEELPRASADGAPSPGGEPEPTVVTAQEGRCANGEDCLHFATLGEPAKLSKSNDDPLCFRCQDAEREDALARAPVGPLVRRSKS